MLYLYRKKQQTIFTMKKFIESFPIITSVIILSLYIGLSLWLKLDLVQSLLIFIAYSIIYKEVKGISEE